MLGPKAQGALRRYNLNIYYNCIEQVDLMVTATYNGTK